MPTDATETNNAARRRYEPVVDSASAAGFVEYQETSELVTLTHNGRTLRSLSHQRIARRASADRRCPPAR
jgi:hypothetical protein